jgi:hypothetical protein
MLFHSDLPDTSCVRYFVRMEKAMAWYLSYVTNESPSGTLIHQKALTTSEFGEREMARKEATDLFEIIKRTNQKNKHIRTTRSPSLVWNEPIS